MPVEDNLGAGGRRPDVDRAGLRVAGLGLVLVGVALVGAGLVLVGALAFGRLALETATFGSFGFGAATFGVATVAARVAARTALVAALVAVLVRRARFLRTGFGRNALIRAEGDRERRVRATKGLSGQETSSSPIRDQSSPGITKFTIRGVSTMAGSIVFMACTK